jgi:ComF family protein
MDLLPLLGPACQYCAHPLPDTDHLICGHCIKQLPYVDRTYIKYSFEEPLRSLLHRFKYHSGLYLSSFLSHLILHAIEHAPDRPECLLPVPLSSQRLRARGFNQAAVMTKILAKKLNIPYDLISCQKRINTAPQASLNRDNRQKNLRQAFMTQTLPYQHIALIDDLLTTGATVNELAYTLKKAGVARVDVWCCARTINKKSSEI